MPKKIWLIMDKANRAGDNGEAFLDISSVVRKATAARYL